MTRGADALFSPLPHQGCGLLHFPNITNAANEWGMKANDLPHSVWNAIDALQLGLYFLKGPIISKTLTSRGQRMFF